MKRILVVDDSATMRRMVMACLQQLPDTGFDQAGSGLEAIERLAMAAADMMILDLNMPDMHGLEVLRFMRQHPTFRGIPVIVLTTRDDPGSREAALQAGAACYLTKPFQPDDLVKQARQFLSAS